MTKSTMTRMPLDRAVRTSSTKSPRLPETRVDAEEVGDVVAVVLAGGRVEGHQPQAGHAEVGEVLDAFGHAADVAGAVAVPVVERLDVGAVEDRVLPPQVATSRCFSCGHRRGAVGDSCGSTCSPNASMKADWCLPTKCRYSSSQPCSMYSCSHAACWPRSLDTRTDCFDLLGGDVLADHVEGFDGFEVPGHRGSEDVVAPLVVGDGERLVLGGRPAEVDLQPGRAASTGVAVGVHHPLQRLLGLVDGYQAICPGGVPCGGRGGDGGADEVRHGFGQCPQPGTVDVDQAVVADLLAPSRRRMTSTHSMRRWSRISLRGHTSPVTRSLDASPDPSAAQNRPGNICASVAIAWAMMTGW